MFTGIVQAKGEIVKTERTDDGTALWIRADVLHDCVIGGSVAVSGVCLTVTERDGDVCRFDVIPESESRSTLAGKQAGEHVNVERPLKAGDELGGHIVQGHVDAIGTVTAVTKNDDGARVRIAIAQDLTRYVIEKGSVTVDGCSLTVSALTDESFEVALIPHTLAVTTLGELQCDDEVNIEVDVLAKYVEKALGPVKRAETQAE